MKALVVYYSETGNTKMVAEAIAEGLETVAKTVGEEDAEFVVIGTPVHGGEPVKQMIDFIKETSAKKAAVFCTCMGSPGDTLGVMESELRKRNIELVGRLVIRVGRRPLTKDHLRESREFGSSLLSKI